MRTEDANIAHFHYIATPAQDDQRRPGHDGSDDDYGSVSSQTALVTYGAYILDSRVNGRLSMIVDIGAFINILGADLARQPGASAVRQESGSHEMTRAARFARGLRAPEGELRQDCGHAREARQQSTMTFEEVPVDE